MTAIRIVGVRVRRPALPALLLALSLGAPAAAVAQTPPSSAASSRTAAARTAARQEALRKEALTKIRGHERDAANQIKSAIGKSDQAALQSALAKYRQAVTAELLVGAAGLQGDARTRFLQQQAKQAQAQYEKVRRDIRQYLINRLAEADSDAARKKIFDSIEDTLRTKRARLEMTLAALARVEPTVYDPNPDVDADVNRTQRRLASLLERISSNYVEEPLRPSYGITSGNIHGASDAERKAEHWLREREREADVAEYVRLARGGVFVDPRTGAVIQGVERQRIGRNAEQQLVETLRKKNLDEGVLSHLMGFADTRGALAAQREADIQASDAYRALDFITPDVRGSQAQEIFLALSVAVRQEQTKINDWRAARVPEGGNGGITGWLYENFVAKEKVGLGRASEIGDWGLTKDSLKQIDRRIAIFQRDADAVVGAFTLAAKTPDPRDLQKTDQGSRAHRLLERYGYITRGKDGAEQYRIPRDSRVSARLADRLDLPGGSWLDIISGANVMKLVVLTAAPELAAARFGTLLEGLEAGTTTVDLGTAAVNAAAGSALDAGIQHYVEGRKIEGDRLAIETLFLAPVIQGVAHVAGEASSALATLLKSRARREAAEKFLSGALGLTSESALQTYWQGQLQGKMSYEDFLSNLLNGAISRAARGALESTYTARSRTVESIRGYRAGRVTLPEAVRNILSGPEGRAARTEVLDRAKESQRRFDEAVRNLRDAIGDDLTAPDAPTKLLTALETGHYSWAELKMLYRSDPERMEPLMRAANEARARFSKSIVETARHRAREQIDREYRRRVDRLKQNLKGNDQLPEALKQAADWRDQQLKLLEKDPFAPGSDNLTSDIDRSVASPYYRNELKRLSDEFFAENGTDRPPTSAQAYDLNEYIDVFPVIRRTRALDLRSESPEGFAALNHDQAVEAASLSGAMLHMTPAERARFKEKTLQAADPAHRRTLEVQFDYAEQSLRRGDRELQAEIDRLVAKGADRNDPDTVVRARDNLYGERTLKLGDMEDRLRRMDPKSPEARKLAAEIELEWSYTLREGIETYATFAGLDAIVINGQLKDLSIRDLINDAGLAGRLKLSPEQARAIANDQILMIVEHAHAFQEGLESALDAGSALGKYAERAVLALKLMGTDIMSGPAGDLNQISELLVRARKDPAQLRLALAKFGNGGEVDSGIPAMKPAQLKAGLDHVQAADVDRGLLRLTDLLQQTLPGLDGVLDPKLLHAADGDATAGATGGTTGRSLAEARARLALQRERQQDEEHERAHYGSGKVAKTVTDRIGREQQELKDLQKDKARTDRLRASYRRADWKRAESLESERASLVRQQELLPDQKTTAGVAGDLRKRIAQVDHQIAALKQRHQTGTDQPTEAEQRRDRRITEVQRSIRQDDADLKHREQQAKDEAYDMDKMDLSIFFPGLGIYSLPVTDWLAQPTVVDPAAPFVTALEKEYPTKAGLIPPFPPVTVWWADQPDESTRAAATKGTEPKPDDSVDTHVPATREQAKRAVPNDLRKPIDWEAVNRLLCLPPEHKPAPAGVMKHTRPKPDDRPVGPLSSPDAWSAYQRKIELENSKYPPFTRIIDWGTTELAKASVIFLLDDPDRALAHHPMRAGSDLTPTETVPPVSHQFLPRGKNTDMSFWVVRDPLFGRYPGLFNVPSAFGPADLVHQKMFTAEDPDSVLKDMPPIMVLADARRPSAFPALTARSVLGFLRQLIAGGSSRSREIGLDASRVDSRWDRGDVGFSRLNQQAGALGADSGRPPLQIVFKSLGKSTGEAFEAELINTGSRTIRLKGLSMVLEPLKAEAGRRVEAALTKVIPRRITRVKLNAYCLELLREPPRPGTIYRIASAATQRKFAQVRSIFDASRALYRAGALKPDSNPLDYFNSIRQWAVWTHEQKFDLKSFRDAFVARTKKNLLALGQTWNRQLEQAVLARVPGRWHDIVTVLQQAKQLQGRSDRQQ